MKTLCTVVSCAALAAVALLLASGRAASSLADPPPPLGRFQAEMVGSRGPQRFSMSFLLDTMSGKAWQARLMLGQMDGWNEILEPEGKAPEAGTEAGRYRISADLISDRIGQDTAVAVRIDTRTGWVWSLRPYPAPATWVRMPEPASGARETKARDTK